MSAENNLLNRLWCRFVVWVRDALIFLALFVILAALGGLRFINLTFDLAIRPRNSGCVAPEPEAVPEGYSDKMPEAKRSR